MNPPDKTSKPTKETVAALDRWLVSITAFHPDAAAYPWLFYEKVDQYLGPWGEKGYPIAYGKKYCRLFYENRVLNQDPSGKAWVTRTLVFLQDALRAFIVRRYADASLSSLTEADLREAAFSSHARAYTKGGLTMVVLLSPDLVAEIASIPGAEFKPTSPTFGRSVGQVLDTSGIVLPEAVGALLGALAGPAHNQIIRYGGMQDLSRFQQDLMMSQRLGAVREAVKLGRCDHLGVLGRLQEGLELTSFTDPTLNAAAASAIHEIENRAREVKARYNREIGHDPKLADVYSSFDPEICEW